MNRENLIHTRLADSRTRMPRNWPWSVTLPLITCVLSRTIEASNSVESARDRTMSISRRCWGPYRVNPDLEPWSIKLDRANFRKRRADATINAAVVAIHTPSATQAIKCDSTRRGDNRRPARGGKLQQHTFLGGIPCSTTSVCRSAARDVRRVSKRRT
jgi:hypothetical protein